MENRGFRKLRWRLALSYTLLTLAALWVVLLGLFAWSTFLALEPLLSPDTFLKEARVFLELPETRKALAAGDYAGVYAALERSEMGLTDNPRELSIRMRLSPPLWHAALIDRQGAILWHYPRGVFDSGKTLDRQVAARDWIAALSALRGQEGWDRQLGGARPRASAAMPLRVNGEPLAVYARMQVGFPLFGLAGVLFLSTLPVALLLSLFALVLGSLFGYWNARLVTRKFQAIARAATDWSAGRFATRVPEAGKDEIDQLAARLNGMAAELEETLTLRQQVAASEERNRLAHDLHDTVKQHLFAATMQAGVLRAKWPGTPPPALEHIEELLRDVQDGLRVIIYNLKPPETNDLSATVRKMALEWKDRSGVAVELAVESGIRCGEVAYLAYCRVLQEGLANVLRHAAAQRVLVVLRRTNGRLELRLEDDGKGFAEDLAWQSMGLPGMRRRMAALPKGRLELRSGPGQGTTVRAECAFEGERL